jgi:hypothetical protein
MGGASGTEDACRRTGRRAGNANALPLVPIMFHHRHMAVMTLEAITVIHTVLLRTRGAQHITYPLGTLDALLFEP